MRLKIYSHIDLFSCGKLDPRRCLVLWLPTYKRIMTLKTHFPTIKAVLLVMLRLSISPLIKKGEHNGYLMWGIQKLFSSFESIVCCYRTSKARLGQAVISCSRHVYWMVQIKQKIDAGADSVKISFTDCQVSKYF